MRLNIQLHVHSRTIPRYVIRGSVHTLVVRSSIFGLHKRMNDTGCSKTELLAFVYPHDANEFLELMQQCQGRIHRFEREIDFCGNTIAVLENSSENNDPYLCTDSIKPMYTDTIIYNHMERMCLMHNFDMLIVYNKRIEQVKEDCYEVGMDCYEYITKETPHRDIQEKILRDMLYYHSDD